MNNSKSGCFVLIVIILIGYWGIKSCFKSERRVIPVSTDNFELGQKALWDKDYQKGILHLSRISESDPNYSQAKELISVAQNALDAQEKAQTASIPKMTEDEYIKYFQAKWDSIVPYQQNGFPQYKTYWDELGKVLEEIAPILAQDSSLSKLKKLEKKLDSSKKSKEAWTNYTTYGQPSFITPIQVCQDYLRDNMNDPSSLDIENRYIDGRTKNGWKITLRYRGKNAFGALILQETTFDVRFNMQDQTYYVANVYE